MPKKHICILTALAAVCIVLAAALLLGKPAPPPMPPESAPQPPPSAASSSEPPASSAPLAPASSDPTADYPEGRLFVTGERDNYQSGDLTLDIPRLGIEKMPVLDGVDDETLRQGIGLYDYAQLPGQGNRNVSIAGHRDLYGCEFYYIDTLQEGDELTLSWRGKQYRYRYKDTAVVEQDDWSPIYIQGFSCLTLTSCTPLGIADHRIIVRAELECILDADE